MLSSESLYLLHMTLFLLYDKYEPSMYAPRVSKYSFRSCLQRQKMGIDSEMQSVKNGTTTLKTSVHTYSHKPVTL